VYVVSYHRAGDVVLCVTARGAPIMLLPIIGAK